MNVLIFCALLPSIHRYLGAYRMCQFYKTLDYKIHNSMKPPGLQNALGVILLCYIPNFSIRNELICQGNEESPELLMSPVIGLPSVEYQGTL